MQTTPKVAHAKAVYPYNGSVASEDPTIKILHPDHGWLCVVLVNDREFCASKIGQFHAWFDFSCPEVALMDVCGAVAFMRWAGRMS